jgi:CxC1 like cysteine cluster associated with KDZ transposases
MQNNQIQQRMHIIIKITFILFAGRLHNAILICCKCESNPATLLRHGFWAARPVEPNVCFSLNLLNMLNLLTLECAVSVKGFLQMLRWKNGWSEMQVSLPLVFFCF